MGGRPASLPDAHALQNLRRTENLRTAFVDGQSIKAASWKSTRIYKGVNGKPVEETTASKTNGFDKEVSVTKVMKDQTGALKKSTFRWTLETKIPELPLRTLPG